MHLLHSYERPRNSLLHGTGTFQWRWKRRSEVHNQDRHFLNQYHSHLHRHRQITKVQHEKSEQWKSFPGFVNRLSAACLLMQKTVRHSTQSLKHWRRTNTTCSVTPKTRIFRAGWKAWRKKLKNAHWESKPTNFNTKTTKIINL